MKVSNDVRIYQQTLATNRRQEILGELKLLDKILGIKPKAPWGSKSKDLAGTFEERKSKIKPKTPKGAAHKSKRDA